MTATSSLVLYHAAPSRSSIVHWMLEELGVPYEVRALSLQKGENSDPAFLALNPMGKVPTLVHDGVPISEAAAICCYLADAFPKAGLNVPVGDPQRGPYLQWLFFGPSCVEPAVVDHMAPRKEPASRSIAGWGSYELTMDVLAKALEKGPYLIGDRFTAADVVIGSGLRWGMWSDLVPKRSEFTAYVALLDQRPAYQRTKQLDEELSAS